MSIHISYHPLSHTQHKHTDLMKWQSYSQKWGCIAISILGVEATQEMPTAKFHTFLLGLGALCGTFYMTCVAYLFQSPLCTTDDGQFLLQIYK